MQPALARTQASAPALASLAAGAVVALVALTSLPWFTFLGVLQFDFGVLHDNADNMGGSGVLSAYFQWGAYLLLAVAVAAVAAANFAPSLSKQLPAVVGSVAGAIGAVSTLVITLYAQHQITEAADAASASDNLTPSVSVVASVGLGPWAAVVGFLAIAAGGVLALRTASAALITGPARSGRAPIAEAVGDSAVRPFDPVYDQVESIVQRWWSSGSTLDRLVRDIHEWTLSGGVQEVEQSARDAALNRVNQYARMALTRVAEENHRVPTNVPPIYIPPNQYDQFGQYTG